MDSLVSACRNFDNFSLIHHSSSCVKCLLKGDEADGECKADGPLTETTLRIDVTLEWDVNCSSINDTLQVAQIFEQAVYEGMHAQLQSTNSSVNTVYVQELCGKSVQNHTGYSGSSSRFLEENNMTDIELYVVVIKACASCEKLLWNETNTAIRRIVGDGSLSASVSNKTDGAIQTDLKFKNTKDIEMCKDPSPVCKQPEDKCMTSNATCLRNSTWTCTEAAKVCEEGYVCDKDSGDCVESPAAECAEELRPTCLRPEDKCMTNSSWCVNNTWTPCTSAPKECSTGFFCK